MPRGSKSWLDALGAERDQPGAYSVAWWAIAAAAMVLVAVIALEFGRGSAAPVPDRALAASQDPVDESTGRAASGAAKSDRSTEDTDNLRAELAQSRADVASLQAALDALGRTNEMIASRLRALEAPVPGGPAAPPAGPSPRPPGATAPSSAPSRPAPSPDAAAQGLPSSVMATLSQRLAAAFPPSSATYGVEIGSFPDLASLRQRWTELQHLEPAGLAALTPLVQVRDRGGRTEFALLAGPLPDARAAGARCAGLAAHALACTPALYVGQPLAAP